MVDRRLGRGLDFFLSGGRGAQPQAAGRADVADLQKQGDDEVLMVDVGSLDVSPYQPRKTIGEAELKELAESIRASGILQPILARRVGERSQHLGTWDPADPDLLFRLREEGP
jgi:ParB family chromosome partitioning protein